MTATLETLLAEREIRALVHRYCRAADRCDRALFKSCYWPDARDNHGFFTGNAHAFVDYVVPILEQALSTTHSITNHVIEIDGDRACGEAYVYVTHRLARADGTIVDNKSCCRYVDLYERRGGEWKIAFRAAILDSTTNDLVYLGAKPANANDGDPRHSPARLGPADPGYAGFDARRLDAPDFAVADFWGFVLAG